MSDLERIEREAKERDEMRRTRIAELGLRGLDELAKKDRAAVDELLAIAKDQTMLKEYSQRACDAYHEEQMRLMDERDKALTAARALREGAKGFLRPLQSGGWTFNTEWTAGDWFKLAGAYTESAWVEEA